MTGACLTALEGRGCNCTIDGCESFEDRQRSNHFAFLILKIRSPARGVRVRPPSRALLWIFNSLERRWFSIGTLAKSACGGFRSRVAIPAFPEFILSALKLIQSKTQRGAV